MGITLPAGYSFNLDGTAIYLTMGSVFLAQALGTDLSLIQQLSMLAVMLLNSKAPQALPAPVSSPWPPRSAPFRTLPSPPWPSSSESTASPRPVL